MHITASASRHDFHITGSGTVTKGEGIIRLSNHVQGAETTRYSNAQFDDYRGLRRSEFQWRAPVRLTIRARFSHGVEGLRGTAGFGFWNDPFLMTETRIPTLPRAIWFFCSSRPSNMDLAAGVLGWGWKAAMIDALRPEFAVLLPLAPAAVPLMRSRTLYRQLWPIAQRSMHVHETALTTELTTWHVYTLEWRKHDVLFWVDGEPVAHYCDAPRGPLGLVVWIDNQYMIVRPWGELRHGVLRVDEEQWLEIDWLHVG